MSAAQHTPGPWMVRRRLIRAAVPVVNVEAHGRRVALVDGGHAGNAALIAVAPDLLRALVQIAINDPFRQSSAGVIARAAIAKAEGCAR